MNYNLLDEKWIPVLYADGRWERVSLLQALEDASEIRQIAASNPMDRVAILRFLIAILYWCKGNPNDLQNEDVTAPIPMDWFEKLGAHCDCFNLLGTGRRFYQSEPYRTIKPEHTINYLIQEVPTGINCYHFRHSTDLVNGLCPSCCAMGLLRLPVFTTSGGRGMTPDSGKSFGINGKPPLYAISMGHTLSMTLRLSWRTVDAALGSPEWETPNQELPNEGKVPLLTGMTWLPRHVWLEEPKGPEEACILCARKSNIIRCCAFDGKGSAKGTNRCWNDPHTLRKVSKKGDVYSMGAADALGASDAAAGQFLKIVGAMSQESADRRIWITSFSTVQNDKYLEATECTVFLPGIVEQKKGSSARFELWQKETAKLARKLHLRDEKAGMRKHAEIPPLLAAIRPEIEEHVASMASALSMGSNEAWEKAAQEYRPMMRAVAESLSPGITTAVVKRRREIAHATPDLRPPAQKNPRKVKGDGK